MNVTFDAKTHVYRVGGREVPSVTTILKPIQADMSTIPPKVLENARRRGVAVDKAIELLENGCLDMATVSDEAKGYLEGFERFKQDYGWMTFAGQRVILGPSAEYAGALDLIGESTTLGKAIADIKCTYVTPKTVHAQIAGYRLGIKHDPVLGEWKDCNGLCVRLKKDGTYEVTEIDFTAGERMFYSCLNIWRFNHG